jgi:hypothetical protein
MVKPTSLQEIETYIDVDSDIALESHQQNHQDKIEE